MFTGVNGDAHADFVMNKYQVRRNTVACNFREGSMICELWGFKLIKL
jgi:arginase family enzyme